MTSLNGEGDVKTCCYETTELLFYGGGGGGLTIGHFWGMSQMYTHIYTLFYKNYIKSFEDS